MQVQNFKNHRRLLPATYYLLAIILLLCFVFALWNGWRAYEHHSGRLVAAIILGLTVAGFLLAAFVRVFALKAQDKAILAQENIRYFALTGKLLPPILSHSQVAALRFADDTEFPLLVDKAMINHMKPNDIKGAIVNWRADNHRV